MFLECIIEIHTMAHEHKGELGTINRTLRGENYNMEA